MKRRILFAGLIFGVALLAAASGAELFQRAVTQEQAAGNLPEAIKFYQQVAKHYASNRPLAAKALVQAAPRICRSVRVGQYGAAGGLPGPCSARLERDSSQPAHIKTVHGVGCKFAPQGGKRTGG